MKLSFNKKAKQRIISFTTAFAIMTNAVPLGGLSNRVLPLVSLNAKAVDAVDEVTTDELTQVNALKLDAETYTVTKGSSEFENNNDYVRYNSDTNNYSITFPNITWFLDYCWHYNHTEGFAATHKNDVLLISLTNDTSDTRGIIPNTFEGLGNSSTPFDGTVKFAGSSFTLQAHRAFFGTVTDSVQLLNDADGQQTELILVRLSDVPDGESLPLLADQVVHNGGTADWKVTLSSASSNSYSGVIGEIKSGASVKLDYTNESSANLASVSSVGEICGTMQDGSSIELTYSATSAHSITSSGGNAGGLVGTMIDNASLTIKSMPDVALNATSTSAYAGGLVGELTSQATITNQTGSAIPVSGSITGDAGAGGLFGHYTNSETEFDLVEYNNTATVDGTYCGGVFGVLENNSTALTVKNTGAGTLTVNSGTTGNTDGYFGGIAGKYTTNALSNSLVLDGLTLTANAKAAYKAFGGALGIVDPAAYVQTTDTMSVTASGTTKANYFGGLVGATSKDHGVFVDLGNFTLNTGNEQFKGGGVVGLFNNGVLRLGGTTDMTNAKPASAANCGQLVGDNNNVLTYAASSWTFSRSSGATTDDLGTWGEVVRVAESDIVTVDSTAHTVTLKAAETSMGLAADFAKTALNIQLNQGINYDCLKFTSGNNTRTYLLGTGLSLSADISLAGTGITGFMRDGGAVSGAVNSIGSFTGTFNGNNHTLTLAIGEKYGNGVNASTNSEGVGQIYRHQHNGLFSVLAGTVQNLTVDGTINVSNCVDGMNIGGIASRNNGDITLTNVIAKETVNYNESAKVSVSDEGKNIGGYIGFVGTKGTITINGVSSIGATFNLKGSHESWNVYGGAIGKITASEFTVNIGTKGDNANKLTNSLTTDISDITNVGANSDSGGLIGYITSAGSYGNRTVNLNNVEFSSCTVGNAASTNGGGFLGYAWLKTTTNVNGVTVTNGTINNTANNKTAGNVGVMLYNSTGKMKVDRLSINGLTMSAGGTTSLGMIVNKAYSLNDKNEVNGALYLDVLNAGYDLTGTTAPAQATEIFDEIAAYSAPNVINGGAGVISINMNESRDTNNANFKTTGTYQNKISVSDDLKANSNARYYYNVDKMSSSDAGQNLVLWSLSKYAYSSISEEFISDKGTNTSFGTTLNTTLSGNADLAGLSFYPIASANENYSIGNLTLTFDYSGIYSTAETVSNGDGYIRDPAVANQHYLMHSGLFIDQPSGKSLTVTGTLSLGGTFMEDSNHQGVLISGTMEGTFLCDIGSIILDGIKPMSGSSAYTSGYLLINNISRTDDLATPPSVTIKNLSNTDKYSSTTGSTYSVSGTTDNVAKSLIGTASGKGLTIIFSKIKLDGRDKTKSDTNLNAEELYNAYKTYNSIFSQSTLLASIHTDQSAKLEYNFTKAHDWGTGSPREVTYGAEIKNSLEYVDEEQRYYPDSNGLNADFVNPVNSSTRSEVYNFVTGFLPYVKVSYNDTTDANGCFKRELKVNVQSVALSSGCGTYNDPYLISDPKVFEAIAKFIASGDTTDLKEVVLPKSPDSDDIISGNRWHDGTDYHATFKASGNDYVSGSNTWSGSDARKYLASAYYKITADLELSSNYLGLGYASESANTTNPAIGDYAFRGVIIGADVPDSDAENAPTHKARITNGSANPFINVSNGSVIKDLNIIVTSNFSLSQANAAYNNAFFGYYHLCKYYGGIFGEVMGGDNIIDNSYVTYSNSKITLSGGKATIVPVGGYVGVVVFGGVIFKNMTATTSATSTELKVNNSGLNVIYTGKTENLADNNKQDDWAAIYVNPIVGRVINGYAVNETTQFSVTENNKYHDDAKTARTGTLHTLKNGTKHYSIADINKNETNKLDVSAVPASASSDGTINIPNSQAFFILSLITQSCAGTAQGASGDYVNSLSYGTNTNVYGMSRNADYTNVGSATDNTDPDYVLASNDTTANSATPYIIDRYCTNHNARCVTSTKGYYDINLTGKTTYNVDSYTYQLPDSFRGIGSVGNFDSHYPTEKKDNNEGQDILEVFADRAKNEFCLKIDYFNGNGCSIDEDIYLNKYQTDNYFDILHKGTNQDVSQNTVGYTPNARSYGHGIGLFDSIILKDTDSKLSDFVLEGSSNTEIYQNEYKTSKNDQIIKTAHTNNFWLSVGGVIGWATNGTCLKFERIQLSNLKISGSSHVGGLIGFSGLSSTVLKIVISECSANDISVEMTSARTNESPEKSRNAIGTFVGKAYESAVVIFGTSDGANNADLTKYSEVKIKSFTFGDPNTQYTVASGGLVGFAGHCCQVYDMKVSSSNSTITIGNSKVRFSGGIVGGMQSVTKNVNETSCVSLFKNCSVENINVAGEYAGGFYGGKWDSAWTPYSITLDNCKMIGKSEKNTIIANRVQNNACAGGFIGRGLVKTSAATNDSNILIKDCVVSNYEIQATGGSSDGQKGVAGGFVGYCSSNDTNSTITCYIHDSSVENCVIGAEGSYSFGGGAIGWVNPRNANYINKMLGYNIKLDNVTSNNDSTMGAWVGYLNSDDKKTSIQFSALAIYSDDNEGFTQNVGNGKTLGTASFVFADYTGKCKGTQTTDSETGVSSTEYPTDISGFSNYSTSTHVEMPKYPYVNINPQSDIGANEIISGDGAVLSATASQNSDYSNNTAAKTMALKIYEDIATGTDSRRYTTFGDFNSANTDGKAYVYDNNKIDAYMKRTVDSNGDRISTYYTEKGVTGNPGYDNFACIVIANNTTEETTALINRYAQLVTNTTTNYSADDATNAYYNIDVKSCKLSDGKFVVDKSATPGLKYSNGQFSLNSSGADSLSTDDTFTLVDIQFMDPLTAGTNTEKIAYHLYVPVYTIKQMEVGFSVAVKTGSSSVSYTGSTPSTDYSSLMDTTENQTHIDSLETWVTQYIRFTYNAGDLNALLQRGKVDWNHDKYVNFATQSAGGDTEARLPNGTFMVLIDPNGNGDKEYYAYVQDFDTYNPSGKQGWIIDLEKFKQGTNNYFEVQDLNAVIARYIEYTQNSSNNGSYNDVTALVETTPNTEYDVYRVDDSNNVHYYKYTAEGNGDSNLTISSNVNEDYYISMYVPKEANYNNELYYYSITGPTELMGLKNAKVNHNNSYNVLVADLYTQDTINRMTVLPEDQQVNASNKKIFVTASTSITINNVNARLHLTGKNLYHSFDLTLNRYTESGVFNDIIGLGDSDDTTRIKATYSIGSAADEDSSSVRRKDLQTNYLNIETAEIMSDLIAASRNNQPLEIYSYIEMDFDEKKLEAEFPEKSSENTIGVNVSATSNLAYDESRLAYTSMSVPFASDGHYYYRESVNAAKLDYTSVTEPDAFDKIGKVSKNQSRLGINGYSPDCYQNEYMPINTEAKYNVSAISETDLAKAERLKLTISLSKKTDKYESGTVTGVEYAQILNLLNYLDDKVLITSGSEYGTGGNGETHTIDENSSSLVVEIPIEKCENEDNIYSIGIGFKAKTGVNFHEYANYMVTLRTELVYTDDNNQEKVVENSSISDYVIYTNAKIFPTLID